MVRNFILIALIFVMAFYALSILDRRENVQQNSQIAQINETVERLMSDSLAKTANNEAIVLANQKAIVELLTGRTELFKSIVDTQKQITDTLARLQTEHDTVLSHPHK